jgi:hypothetical protein
MIRFASDPARISDFYLVCIFGSIHAFAEYANPHKPKGQEAQINKEKRKKGIAMHVGLSH